MASIERPGLLGSAENDDGIAARCGATQRHQTRHDNQPGGSN
jgi:hypothetical protein